jgi:hypothetical protein
MKGDCGPFRVALPSITAPSFGSRRMVPSPPGSLIEQLIRQLGSVSKTQWAAVITILEVSSDPPQSCSPSTKTAACHGYWAIEALCPPTILGWTEPLP